MPKKLVAFPVEELVALGDHFIHFGGGIVHLESSSSLAAIRTRGILIDVEVRRECAHKSVDVPFHQCHDKVEIAGHARLAVIPKRK